MGASVWEGSAEIVSTANADNTFLTQRFTVVTQGQTLFTLTDFAYAINTNSLAVRVNGVEQKSGVDFTETSTSTFTFIGTDQLEPGDVIDAVGLVGGDGATGAVESAAIAVEAAEDAEAALAAILALSLPALPLTIANGGTGQITKAAAFLALAPNPVANKVLGSTDGLTYTLVDASPIGGGTGTDAVVLTATSAASQVITPTTHGKYITLPDATTYASAAPSLFSITNASDYDLGIKNSAGTVLGWLYAGENTIVSLNSKASAAGVWNFTTLNKIGITASLINTSTTLGGTASVTAPPVMIAVDANRTMFLTASTAGVAAVIYNSSTQTWGTPVVLSGTTNVVACLSGANQVLACVYSGTNINMQTLTLAGTAITVNAAVIASSTSTINSATLISLGTTSFALAYGRAAPVQAIRNISLTGTVPAASAETVLASAASDIAPNLYQVTATTVLAVQQDDVQFTARVYTVTGAGVPVLVNSATSATGYSETPFTPPKSLLTGNTRWLNLVCKNNLSACLVNVAAGVPTISTLTVSTNYRTGTGALITDQTDVVAISASKFFVFYRTATSYGCRILTDTAGVLSQGSELLFNSGTAIDSGRLFFVSLVGNTLTLGGSNQGSFITLVLDVSGTTPTLSTSIYQKASGLPNLNIGNTDKYNVRNGNLAYINNTVIHPNPNASGVSNNAYSFKYTSTGVYKVKYPNLFNPTGIMVAGQASNESWYYNSALASTTTGLSLQRLEVAA